MKNIHLVIAVAGAMLLSAMPVETYAQLFAGTSGSGEGKVYAYQGGTNWTAISPSLGYAVLDIINFNGTLFAATESAYEVGEVWRYDGGTSWTVVGTNMDYEVCDLEIYNSQLYAGTASRGGKLYRYNAISNHFDYVGSVSGFYGIGALYSSSYGYLQLGNLGDDAFGRYDGTNLYFDADFGGSCIYDFAEYSNKLYAAAYCGRIYSSTNGIDWSLVLDCYGPHLWKLDPFQGQLYLGYENGELAYIDSSEARHSVLTVSDSIISMAADRDSLLYFGTGAEQEYGGNGSGPGYVYTYAGNGATNATLISGPMGSGVQCLYYRRDPLQITPPIGFDATGCVGGPFSKTNETFILTNTGTNSLDWSLANPSLWLDASLGSGTLVAGGSTNVTVSLNSYAYSLTSGLYAATVWFTNLNDGVGQSRQFTLAVDLLTILSQPQSLTVSTGFPAWFSVSVSGTPPLFFQWQKDGTNLTDGGNISGSTTATLELNPTTTNDAGNYRVIITNACGKIVTSSNATLILDSVHNLIWTGYPNSTWDLNTSPDWVGPQKFNDGDNVTFDDTGSDNFDVKLVGPNLNARSVTVASQYYYDLVGTGNFNGPGILIYKGSAPGVCGPFEIDNANGYSGGTIVSNNAAELIIHNYAGLGTGPLILNCPSGGTAPYPDMEVTQVGNACVGVAGDIQVLNNFNVVFYTAGAYGGSFLGNLSGTTGKTLTISDTSDTVPTNVIVRLYGDNTVYNGNLNLSDSRIIWACYEPDGSQVYNGVISGTGSLIQGNSGLTILNGAETYTGSTIVSNGTLQINGSLNASSAVTVQSDGVLAGSGIINRPVNVLANGWIAGGAATIGTLNLGSTLTFNGGSAMARINRNGGSSQADKINVTGAINNNGVGFVVVTNQGAPLLVGDTFTLFNKGVTGGNNFIVTGAKVSWNNNLASTPATISVANTNPAVITPTLAGSTLTLSWPGYTGWILQSNMVSLLTPTNWVTVPNSAYINRINIGINYATTNVFYRLISQ